MKVDGATPRWLSKGSHKPIHGSCAIYFPGGQRKFSRYGEIKSTDGKSQREERSTREKSRREKSRREKSRIEKSRREKESEERRYRFVKC